MLYKLRRQFSVTKYLSTKIASRNVNVRDSNIINETLTISLVESTTITTSFRWHDMSISFSFDQYQNNRIFKSKLSLP